MAKHKINPDDVRRRISTALLNLNSALSQHASDVIPNPDVIRSAINSLERDKSGQWAYQIDGLRLLVKVPQKTIPASCAGFLTVDLGIELSGLYELDDNPELVTRLIMNLDVKSSDGKYVCAWHFDKHIGEQEGDGAHPLFHFQHGGHGMAPYASSLGSMLLLPTPRLPFPPMDATLAVDFALANFAGERWRQLRDVPEYRRLVVDAQARYWKPYVGQLMAWWGSQGPRPTDKIAAIWPQLAG